MQTDVYRLAEHIALQYGGLYMLRSLDVLHLATALDTGVNTFATYDGRLATAASKLGLSVLGARP